MKTTRLLSLLGAICFLSVTAQVSAAMTLDTIDASSGQADTFFVPSPGLESDAPYFRFMDEDWGWQHNAITDTINSATLNISAFDVDNPSSIPGTANEIDEIQAKKSDGTWVTLGALAGTTNSFSFTTFNLDSTWFDEIAAGLMVQILIDQNDTNFWGVSLAKSVLSIDGAPLPDPNPVPLPAAVWLFGTAILGLAGFGRRKSKA